MVTLPDRQFEIAKQFNILAPFARVEEIGTQHEMESGITGVKRDDFPDGFVFENQHDQPIDTERNTAGRWQAAGHRRY